MNTQKLLNELKLLRSEKLKLIIKKQKQKLSEEEQNTLSEVNMNIRKIKDELFILGQKK